MAPKTTEEKREMVDELRSRIEETAKSLGGERKTYYEQQLHEIGGLQHITQVLDRMIYLRNEQMSEARGGVNKVIEIVLAKIDELKEKRTPQEVKAYAAALRGIINIPEELTKKSEIIRFLEASIRDLEKNLGEMEKERERILAVSRELVHGYA